MGLLSLMPQRFDEDFMPHQVIFKDVKTCLSNIVCVNYFIETWKYFT